MAMTDAFTDAVSEQRTRIVRIMLKDSLLVDPTFREFDEMIDYASKRLEDLYDEHDGEELIFDKSQWNTDYLNRQMVEVVGNFSKERIALLRDMVSALYGEDKRSSDQKAYQRTMDGKAASKSGVKTVGLGIAACGAAAAIAGIITAKGLIITGGAVAAAIGVVSLIINKEK